MTTSASFTAGLRFAYIASAREMAARHAQGMRGLLITLNLARSVARTPDEEAALSILAENTTNAIQTLEQMAMGLDELQSAPLAADAPAILAAAE